MYILLEGNHIVYEVSDSSGIRCLLNLLLSCLLIELVQSVGNLQDEVHTYMCLYSIGIIGWRWSIVYSISRVGSVIIDMGCTPSKDGDQGKESATLTNRYIRSNRQTESVVLKAVESGQYSEMKGFESDPRCPLSERQLYSICKSWKAINRDMVTTAVNMFLR